VPDFIVFDGFFEQAEFGFVVHGGSLCGLRIKARPREYAP